MLGRGARNERHGMLSNSPPLLLMPQLHHYLAHTLGLNRLREEEEEDDRQVYQTKHNRDGGGSGGLLPSVHCWWVERVGGSERKTYGEEREAELEGTEKLLTTVQGILVSFPLIVALLLLRVDRKV